MNKFYITTAIDYVNDTIHLGHAYQKIIADVLARYHRIKTGKENVLFLTGTDEYGKKAEQTAKVANLTPKELVKKISDSDQKQQDALEISYDRFIRTTDHDHQKVVEEIWARVEKNGDIYLDEYEGIYCEGCEAYYTEKDLIGGKCPFHPNKEVKKVKEKNYFFRWSKYKNFLIKHIKTHPGFIFPQVRAKEMLEFAKEIKDIPVSRNNFTWGIPVPGDPEQVIYVWFDALINYLTGAGFLHDENKFKKFWPADLHVLGKDNLRWHSLLWPAMLKSAGLPLPGTILVNGFLTINNHKISKSLGNVIKPTDWTDKYGADAVRYYLMRYTMLTDDSDISEEKLITAYNADLANGLGNLIARVAKLCESTGFSQLGPKNREPEHLIEDKNFLSAMEEYRFHDNLHFIWQKITKLDQYLNEEKPWELLKTNNQRTQPILGHCVDQIQEISLLLEPFMPATSEKIKEQFKGPKIISQKPLFPRI